MLTNFYIDGFNLYHGCVAGGAFKWLNLVEMCRHSFPAPQNVVHRVRYFTARVRAYPDDIHKPERQADYLRALTSLPQLSTHFGQFRTDRTWMKLVTPLADGTPKVYVERSREKGSDVSLAAHLMADAVRGDGEASVVVTNDPDQSEPIRLVRHLFPGRPVLVLFPVRAGRHGANALKAVASEHATLAPAVLAASQFPPVVVDAKGRTVRRPPTW